MANLKITRNQLAAFLKDHESIKQFENLFALVAPLAPDFPNESNTEAQNASSRATEALSALNRIANALELLALAPSLELVNEDQIVPPVVEFLQDLIVPATPAHPLPDDLSPPVQVGTLGQQQTDNVNITGGVVSARLKNTQTVLLETTDTLSDGAGAAAGTLLNAPAAGNPTKWVAIDDNGTTRYIPAW